MSAASSSVVEAQVALGPELEIQSRFEELYREYFGFAWASLRRLGVPPAAIDDAAQDLWVTVHRRLDSYDPDASLKAWIFGIARRVASHYRRSAQRNARKIAALSFDEVRRSDQPIGRREIAMTMEAFLQRLDETKRVAFVLSELEGWSAPEIARVAGTNANTIYSRIRLAKQQLRDHFAAADAEAYLETAIEEVKLSTRPPRGAAKHCWIALAPKLGGGSAAAASTGIGAALAKLKFVALGAAVGSVALVGVDAALPEAPAHAAAPVVAVEREATEPEPAPAERGAPKPPVHAPVDERVEPPAEPSLAAASPQPVATPIARVQTSTPAPSKAAPRAPVVEEPSPTVAPAIDDDGTSLLLEARTALKQGDAAKALELVATHARRFPKSKLFDLRGVIEVDALCMSGRREAARERAQRLAARDPDSTAAKRVRDACED